MKASRCRKKQREYGLFDDRLQRTSQFGEQGPTTAFRKFGEYMGLVKAKDNQGPS
jgi:hypothetical protein